MLTDGDLKKLGSLSKSNPQKKEWTAMKLYLLEQVRRLRAIVQHGRSHDDDAWWPQGGTSVQANGTVVLFL